MRKLLYKSGTGIGLALLSSPVLAATLDQEQTALFGQVQMYVLIAFVIIVAATCHALRPSAWISLRLAAALCSARKVLFITKCKEIADQLHFHDQPQSIFCYLCR